METKDGNEELNKIMQYFFGSRKTFFVEIDDKRIEILATKKNQIKIFFWILVYNFCKCVMNVFSSCSPETISHEENMIRCGEVYPDEEIPANFKMSNKIGFIDFNDIGK